ncbi:MAG: hypothetical protein GF307_03775 [candidate division Zixibacteria bacterium]|nr:hypothetical protein [candidate division Zixibacteria bacterium]
MSNRRSVLIRLSVLFLVVFGVALVNGCGKNSPVAPGSEQTDVLEQKEPFGPSNVEQQWGRVFYWRFENAAYGYVDNGGGTMNFSGDGYDAQFQVPDNAVDYWVELWMEGQAYYTESGMVYVFEFGPDGLQFREDATLIIETKALKDYNDNGSIEGAELMYWDPDQQDWQFEEFDDDSDGDGYYEFKIGHFSRYGIGGRIL